MPILSHPCQCRIFTALHSQSMYQGLYGSAMLSTVTLPSMLHFDASHVSGLCESWAAF